MLSIPMHHIDRLDALALEMNTLYYLHTLEEFHRANPPADNASLQAGQADANAWLWDRMGEALEEMWALLRQPDFTSVHPDPPEA